MILRTGRTDINTDTDTGRIDINTGRIDINTYRFNPGYNDDPSDEHTCGMVM